MNWLMFLAMVAHIVFPANERRNEISLRQITSCKIENSIDLLSDTATISLPLNIKSFRDNDVKDLFRRNDEVIIYLGYDGNLVKEFEGYIIKTTTDVPLVIECRDKMWQLMKQPAHFSFKSTTLPALFELMFPNQKIDALEVDLGTVRFSKATVGLVLQKLKDDFGLTTYLDEDGTIVCGKFFVREKPTVKYVFERNMRSDNLKFRNADDILIKLTLVSVLRNGNKIEVVVGDEDGEERRVTYYNITNKAKLNTLANEDLKRFKQTSLEGSFDAFGIPFAKAGYKAELSSLLHPEKNGTYLMQSVNVEYSSSSGYKRTITLSRRSA